MTEPEKESVRIALPSRPDKTPTSASAVKQETVRIVLPSRTPVAPVRRVPPKITLLPASDSAAEPATISARRSPIVSPQSVAGSPLLQPLPKPPGPETHGAVTPLPASEPRPARSTQTGPKKETARISILPRPTTAPAPSINLTKTQPLLIRPAAGIQPAPVVVTAKPLDPFDSIPRSFCWGLFGIAALIFLIQIWNYVVS